jgi:hypothetical protein
LVLKSANCKFVNSGTRQGFVFGRGTGGSALTVLLDPIWGVEGAMTTWALTPPGIRR